MALLKAISKRLLYALVTLLFLSLVTFLADEMAPGDQATVLAGEKGSLETITRLRTQLGLDRPWPIRYGEYVGNLARGDFGRSYYGTKEPVNDIIARNLPMTLKLAGSAIFFAALIGIVAGTVAAIKRERWPDRSVLIFSTLGVTIPTFVLAPILIITFGQQGMDLLPGQWDSVLKAPEIYYLLLPVLVMAARPTAQITRLTRASMIDTLQQEFIKLAIAKGVPPMRLYTKHALRNAILPVVTALGTNFGFLLTGSFIVERAFLLPGVGREAIEAIQKGDTPVIQATTLIAASLFVLVNLVVDLAVPVLDPRVREAQV